jgi:hypothetical protein
MGIGYRFYFVEDDDTIHRFPFSRYEKLIRSESKEEIPKYAGKRIRCAFMTLQLEGRKPHRILRSEYPILTFDANGKFDSDVFEEELRLAMETLPPIMITPRSSQVIDAQHHFARRRYHNEFKWKPKPEIENRIYDAIFAHKTF